MRFDELPAAYLLLLPELEGVQFPAEVVSTCASCAMAPKPTSDPALGEVFTAEARCCTYMPTLANFLVGRVLRAGDLGSRRMLDRLAGDRSGLSAWSVSPPEELSKRYAERAPSEFGRMEDFVCPYWAPGELSCTIHANRNAICRTWHCKYVDGARGQNVWMTTKALMIWMEQRLAKLCIDDGDPPGDDASRDELIVWYLWCANRVDRVTADEVEALKTNDFRSDVIQLRAHAVERDAAMPDVLQPTLRDWRIQETGVAMTAYSRYDMREMPKWAFVLISKFDGKIPWREALAAAEAELGEPIGESLVREMYKLGLLSVAEPWNYGPGRHVVMRRMPFPDAG